jgi:Protein of unknown function (DUF4232)
MSAYNSDRLGCVIIIEAMFTGSFLRLNRREFMRISAVPRETLIAAARTAVLVCAVAAAAAGCGLQKTPGSGGSGAGGGGAGSGRQHQQNGGGAAKLPTTSGSPSASVTECTIGEVQVKVDAHAAGVAAGSSYLPLDFTNTSGASCQLAGFPAVTIASGRNGKQVGTAAAADTSAAAKIMVLSGGQTAHIWLRVTDVANIPKSQCKPVAAAGLRVGLPGAQQTTYIGQPITTCARTVRGTQVLTVEPFQPGAARPGTAQ